MDTLGVFSSANGNRSYSRNLDYTESTQFRPSVLVLEPADIDRESGVLRIQVKPFDLHTRDFGNPLFLHALATQQVQSLSHSIQKNDWAYSLRHGAQTILPFLYLGPVATVRSPDFITQAGITMVIAVRNGQAARKQPKLLDPARFPSCANIKTTTFDVDSPYEVITKIRPILKSMVDHLEQMTENGKITNLDDIKGKILVFCESGNERSPALIAAFLMLLYGLNWQDAVNFIHVHRFSVCLNTSMNDMLRTWEDILKALSDTEQARSSAILEDGSTELRQITNAKRGIDDMYDSDEDMNVNMGVELRPGIAPFKDAQPQARGTM